MSAKEDKTKRAIDKMTKRYQDSGMTPSQSRDRAREIARLKDRKKNEK